MEWRQRVNEITEAASHIPQIKPEDVPEIDLYMDQLITFLDKRLHSVSREDDAAFMTNTMVNNYTKAKLIPTAMHKRYGQQHVLGLSIIGQLKKVLSMQDLGKISATVKNMEDGLTLYNLFLKAQKNAAEGSNILVGEAVKCCDASSITDDNTALAVIAVQLAAEAQCMALLAEQLLDAIELPKTEESRKKVR